MFKYITKSLMGKLISMFLLVAIIPLIIIGILFYNSARSALEEEIFKKLTATREASKSQILERFRTQMKDIEILTISKDVADAVDALFKYHDTGGGTPDGPYDIKSSRYQDILREMDPFFSTALNKWGYHDLYVICGPHGHVMYSVAKESDLGENLGVGKLKNSGLAKLWQKITTTKKQAMVDFTHYDPHGEPSAFLGVPFFDEKGNVKGLIALQITAERMNKLVQVTAGMGETGEVYLVGEDHLMRSDSRFSTTSSILKTKVETKAARDGLDGKTGEDIIEDYRGVSVLSSYTHLGLNKEESLGADFDLVVISEIDESEGFAPVYSLATQLIWIIIIIGVIVALIAFFASRGIARPILEGVNVLSTSVSEISSTVSQLSASATQTVTAITETTSTVEEVRQTAQLAKDRSKEVEENSNRTIQVAKTGESSVEETSDRIEKIREQMESIADSIMKLSEQSQAIGEIIATINGLAEQSNLLAVNASIEAAKSGEHGKGFTVVANEVRSLAEQSKQATQQVREILNDIQKATSTAVMATEQGTKAVEVGVEQANITGEAIKELAGAIKESTDVAIQIGASTQQQFVGIDQVNIAIKSIRDASAQNLESTKQLESAAKQLEELGEKLKSMVG